MIAAIAGSLYTLGFAPYEAWWLIPIALALLLCVQTGRSPKQAAGCGFAFGFVAFLTGIYWITISVHTFGGAPYALAAFLMLALVAFMASYFALFCWVLRRFVSDPGKLSWLIAVPGLLTLTEWLRGWVLTGFGWLSPGYAQIDGPLHGYLPVIGMPGTGFVVALTAAAVTVFVLRPGFRNILYPAVLAIAWVFGTYLSAIDWTRDTGTTLKASLVQGAVPQDQKWLPEQLQPTIDLYLSLSAEHVDSDLIIWPEAAIPRYKHYLEPLWNELERVASMTNTDFLVGTVEFDEVTNRRYNSVTAFGASNEVYRKRHLVPFGEYFPVPGFIKEHMRLMNLPYQNFSAGEDGQPPLQVANHSISVSICYEDVFGQEMLDNIADASVMVNVSNDAWFGGSLAPHQHLQIARVRAAEAGRYLLRSTNNGISAVIDRKGRIIGRSPQFEPFVLNASVNGTTGITPYTRFGDWPAIIISLIGAAIGVIRRQ